MLAITVHEGGADTSPVRKANAVKLQNLTFSPRQLGLYSGVAMPHSMIFHVTIFAIWLLLTGCQAVQAPPSATSSITNQQRPQHRAQKFDPLPDTRIGPRIAGLRPPGYRKPISEPARSRGQAKQLKAAVLPLADTP